MKKLLLFILFSISFFAKSQTSVYHPFPDSNAIWNVDYTCCWGISCAGNLHEEQYSYSMGADTIINSITYHKIYMPHVVSLDSCDFGLTQAGYVGGIRQDIFLRKVYIVPPASAIEFLLYDFSLQVNDTIKGYLLYSNPNSPIITSIDSIFIGGNYRKRWNWEWVGGTGNLIEGIGSSLGLLEDLFQNFDNPITDLLCFNQDRLTLYPASNISCVILDAVPEFDAKKITLTISPNPFHTNSKLNLPPEFENAEMKIYSPTGTLIMTEKFFHRSVFDLNRKDFTDGMYFIQLVSDRGQIANSKFIVD